MTEAGMLRTLKSIAAGEGTLVSCILEADSRVAQFADGFTGLVGTGVANTTGTGVANTAGTGVANTAGTGQVTNTAGTAGNTGTAASLPITTGAGPYQNTTRSSLAQPTTTAAQSVSCSYQDATPENPAACTCVSGSSTTIVQPMVIASVEMITQSCAYSTWPITQAAVTTPPPIVSTNFPGTPCLRTLIYP